jgi:hypothetical protein
MPKQVFNTFWYGPALTPMHWACLASFVAHGHTLRVFGYEPMRLPKGAVFEDAARILPKTDLFEFQNSFSAFSNIFRYKLLLEQGGWWVDTDVVCLSGDIVDSSHAWARQDEDDINGALLRFPAGDTRLAGILEEAQRIGREIKVWGELGPSMLTRHLAAHAFDDHFGSTREFYPVHWLEPHLLWLPEKRAEVERLCAGAPFVHLWGSMFSYYGIDLAKAPPAGSWLDALFDAYPPPTPLTPLSTDDELASRAAIRRFLELGWVRKRSQRLFGRDLSEALPA